MYRMHRAVGILPVLALVVAGAPRPAWAAVSLEEIGGLDSEFVFIADTVADPLERASRENG